MGLHADDEPELGPDPRVATVSLGAGRRFVVKPRRKEDGQRQDLELGHGALLVMGAPASATTSTVSRARRASRASGSA